MATGRGALVHAQSFYTQRTGAMCCRGSWAGESNKIGSFYSQRVCVCENDHVMGLGLVFPVPGLGRSLYSSARLTIPITLLR